MVNGDAIKGPRKNCVELKVQKEKTLLHFIGKTILLIRKGSIWSVNPRAVLTLNDLRELFVFIPGLEVEVQYIRQG